MNYLAQTQATLFLRSVQIAADGKYDYNRLHMHWPICDLDFFRNQADGES